MVTYDASLWAFSMKFHFFFIIILYFFSLNNKSVSCDFAFCFCKLGLFFLTFFLMFLKLILEPFSFEKKSIFQEKST